MDKHKVHQQWDKKRKQKAIKLYRSGLTIREVANELGSNLRHVGRVLKEAGVTRDKKIMYKGAGNPAWTGGRRVDADGYVHVYCPDHPFADSHGCVLEHRLVMEQQLGRYLLPSEVIHHKGSRQDNDPCKLELYPSNGDHLSEELAGRVPNWSDVGKERVRKAALKGARVSKERRLAKHR